MANAQVEKIKEFGLRFGDKVVVALASVAFVVCVALALNKKTIDLKPDEVRKAAEQSEANLNRRQERDDIIKTLESAKIVDTDFSSQVQDLSKSQLVADNFKAEREWVTPEPGAGLIRDTPTLIAPTDLFAYPGRGGALVYALDPEGNRIPDTEAKDRPRDDMMRRGRGRMGGMSGMMGGMMGGMMRGRQGGRGSARREAELERLAKADEEQRKREIQAKMVGKDEPAKVDPEEAKAKAEAEKAQGPPPKEIVKGLRWVAITGTLDHGQMLANYREALKNHSMAHPNYARLDLQRQVLQRDNTWSDWEDVDEKQNYQVLDNLPEHDEELTPDTVRPDNLVDPLPFLKAGLWEKVHIASLVPRERKEVVPAAPMGGMMDMEMMGGKGGGMMRGGMGGMMRGGMGGMMRGGGMPGMMRGGGMPGMGGMMRGGMGGKGMMGGGNGDDDMPGMMRGGMGGMGNMGGGSEPTNFWKSEEKKVMVRGLDFTVEPDMSYRYRVRIVVFNPNYHRDDINPGVDKNSKELFGPWSKATDQVHMPADVTAYAMGSQPSSPKSDMKVAYQVVRFNPDNGVTVPANFTAQPGEIIGDVRARDVPVSDGTGKKIQPIDFNTREVVLDGVGGYQPLPSGFNGGAIERPAQTLLLRPDGVVVMRNQPDDLTDEVRKDIEKTYAREIKDSDKKRFNSMGSSYMGMMGMGGMGGMGGGR